MRPIPNLQITILDYAESEDTKYYTDIRVSKFISISVIFPLITNFVLKNSPKGNNYAIEQYIKHPQQFKDFLDSGIDQR